jgi:O-antigen/teichoic acid export membrane protein
MTGVMVIDRTIGLVSTLILARLLFPADFGLVAMCASVVAALDLLTAFGFDMALIQRQDCDRQHYDTAWTLRAITISVVAVAIALAAYPTAAFYGEYEIENAMFVLAASYFLTAFENIAVVDFRKHMQFHKEALLRLSQKLFGFAVVVPSAYLLRNYWALILGVVAQNLAVLVSGYVMKPYRPRFTLSRFRDIFSFSSWILLTNGINYLKNRASAFVLGRLDGAHGLGLFRIGEEVATLPATHLVASLNRAIFPGYAKLAADRDQLKSTYVRVLGMIGLISLPITFGIAAVADLIVPVVLGDRWHGAEGIVRILAFHGLIAALLSNTVYVFLALGRPKVTTLISAFQVSFLVPLMFWLVSRHGLQGAAWALLTNSAVAIIPATWCLRSFVGVRLGDLAAAIWRPVTAGAVMFFSVLALQRSVIDVDLIGLGTAIAFGAVVYVTVLVGLAQFGDPARSVEHVAFREYLLPLVRSRLRKLA